MGKVGDGLGKNNKQKQMECLVWQDIIPLFLYYLTSEMGECRIIVDTDLSVIKHQVKSFRAKTTNRLLFNSFFCLHLCFVMVQLCKEP